MIQVVGCCDASHYCRATDGVSRDTTCKYGDGTTSAVDVSCDSNCFAYISIDSNDAESVKRGCLSDLDLSDTAFSAITSCTSSIQEGSCLDANNQEECLRCCTGNSCNAGYTSKSALLDN